MTSGTTVGTRTNGFTRKVLELSADAVAAEWTCKKRDGSVVPFDCGKVRKALFKCFHGVNPDVASTEDGVRGTELLVEEITKAVVNTIEAKHLTCPEVEQVQQFVIQQLWAKGLFDAAEHYQNYREEHRKKRAARPIPADVQARFTEMKEHFPSDLQIYQLMAKFARWNDELKRRETWKEVVYERVCPWLFKQDGITPDNLPQHERDELAAAMYNLEASPAMRVVQMAGPALDRCHVGAYNCAYAPTDDVFSFPELLYILMQGTGQGFSTESEYVSELPRIKRQRGKAPEVVKVDDDTEGWCDSYRRGLELLWDGYDFVPDVSGVRKKNSRLKTKGGRASGPEPLCELFDFSRGLIKSLQGRYMEPHHAHRLNCFTGRIVQVGGVRRAALIGLSDILDQAIRDIKSGTWWATDKFWRDGRYLSMSNNSAVYECDGPPPVEVFMEEWLALVKSKAGERGIFNRQAVLKHSPKRRKWGRHKPGCNPCFHPDTRIATAGGLERIGDMFGRLGGEQVVVDRRPDAADSVDGSLGVTLKPATQVELTRRQADVYALTTEHGHRVVCTDNHTFPTADGRKELHELEPGDTLLLQSDEGRFGTWGSFADGLLLGLITGDGCVSVGRTADETAAFVDLWADDLGLMDAAGEAVNAAVAGVEVRNARDYGPVGWNPQVSTVGKVRMGGRRLARWLTAVAGLERPTDVKLRVPECVWTGSRDAVRGYLGGLFETDGSVNVAGHAKKSTVSLRLCQANRKLLEDVQVLLQNFGVTSRIYHRRPAGRRLMPDGRDGHAEYVCTDTYDLVVNRPNAIRLLSRIGLPGRKGDELHAAIAVRGEDCNKPERFITRVKAIEYVGKEDVYCLNQPDTHTVVANGVVAGQCAEINLRPRQFCNLTIVIARAWDTVESLCRKVRLAAIFGKIQSLCTKFKYIRGEWKKNCEEERLLGVDISGHADCPLLRYGAPGRAELLRKLNKIVDEVDIEYSRRFGVNRSAANTTVKPGGDSAIFFDCASGVSPRYARRQVRWVREPKESPVARFLVDQGVPHADAPEAPGELFVFGFPKAAPEGSTLRDDMTALEQFRNWLEWKENWAEHSVSATIYVEDHEWPELGAEVYKHFEHITGLAFLPKDNGTYKYAPNEELTDEQYAKMEAEFPDLNWAKLTEYEDDDNTVTAQTFACVGDKC